MRDMKTTFRNIIGLCLLGGAPVLTGCSHQAATTSPAPSSQAAPASGTAAPFQPFALVNQPAPKPAAPPAHHLALRLVHQGGTVCLADDRHHLYQVGRDSRGHLFPVYTDPTTHATYPLYYDPDRDRLYRLAHAHGHYYRGYVDDADNRLYEDDWDYERVTPGGRPYITNVYNTYNVSDDDGYGYPPPYACYPDVIGYDASAPVHHSHHSDDAWLWAIPVVVGAYLLLQPHHNSWTPRPPVRPQVVAVRQYNPVTVNNRTYVTQTFVNRTTINQNRTTINQTSVRQASYHPTTVIRTGGTGAPAVGRIAPVVGAVGAAAAVHHALQAPARPATLTHPAVVAAHPAFAAHLAPSSRPVLAAHPALLARPAVRPRPVAAAVHPNAPRPAVRAQPVMAIRARRPAAPIHPRMDLRPVAVRPVHPAPRPAVAIRPRPRPVLTPVAIHRAALRPAAHSVASPVRRPVVHATAPRNTARMRPPHPLNRPRPAPPRPVVRAFAPRPAPRRLVAHVAPRPAPRPMPRPAARPAPRPAARAVSRPAPPPPHRPAAPPASRTAAKGPAAKPGPRG